MAAAAQNIKKMARTMVRDRPMRSAKLPPLASTRIRGSPLACGRLRIWGSLDNKNLGRPAFEIRICHMARHSSWEQLIARDHTRQSYLHRAGRVCDGPRRRVGRAMKLPPGWEMIRVALTDAAYDAIASTLPEGAARWPMQRDRGQCFIQVEAAAVDRMRAMRRPGESYSLVILRLVDLGG
jgi:hypothetical protein